MSDQTETFETAPPPGTAAAGTATASSSVPAGVAIRLDKVGKHFPGQAEPAVGELSMDIATGDIVILIGPSGCGKTTTLRMMNRMEEPTSGHIYLDGEDIMRSDPDLLRRHIGYVIQQIGLFPHMTIAENIGLIPKVLRWQPDRIRARTDELLDLVGLDPARYRSRYPKELSGGQQQRVGVARALSADPPVMLMDEPFGAIDPITRERLQDEFLGLQERIRKTIVFVTHDIREAMKLGTKVALLDVGGVLAQYDTPERLLTAPSNQFVSDFIGPGKQVQRLDMTRIGAVELEPIEGEPPAGAPRVRADDSLYEALDALLQARSETAVVVDGDGRVLGGLAWSTVLRGTDAGAGARTGGAG